MDYGHIFDTNKSNSTNNRRRLIGIQFFNKHYESEMNKKIFTSMNTYNSTM